MDHVSRTIFKNRFLEVGLTRNWETTTLWMFTNVDLFYFIICEDPMWIKIHWHSIWLRARSHMASHYSWGSVTALQRDCGGVLGQPLDTLLLGSYNYMVTALGLCVKWPLLHGMAYPKTCTKVWVPIQFTIPLSLSKPLSFTTPKKWIHTLHLIVSPIPFIFVNTKCKPTTCIVTNIQRKPKLILFIPCNNFWVS